MLTAEEEILNAERSKGPSERESQKWVKETSQRARHKLMMRMMNSAFAPLWGLQRQCFSFSQLSST